MTDIEMGFYREGQDRAVVTVVDNSDAEMERYSITIVHVVRGHDMLSPGQTFELTASKTVPGAAAYAGWQLDRFTVKAPESAVTPSFN